MIPLVNQTRGSREEVAPCRVSAPALHNILDALFFRRSEQLILRVKRPAAVGRLAVEGQVEFQAVGQKLHGTCELLGAVAERPEHGGGVSAQGLWDQGASAICGDEALELVEPVAHDGDLRQRD